MPDIALLPYMAGLDYGAPTTIYLTSWATTIYLSSWAALPAQTKVDETISTLKLENDMVNRQVGSLHRTGALSRCTRQILMPILKVLLSDHKTCSAASLRHVDPGLYQCRCLAVSLKVLFMCLPCV